MPNVAWLAPTIQSCEGGRRRLMACHQLFDAVITPGPLAAGAVRHLRARGTDLGPVVVRGRVDCDRSRAAFLVLPGAADWLARRAGHGSVLRVVGAGGYLAMPSSMTGVGASGRGLRWLYLPDRPHALTDVTALLGALGVAAHQNTRAASSAP
jgi:hypothetical protein